MRPATVHDIVIISTVSVVICCASLVLQAIVISKSTIPADAVITDIRLFRSESANHHTVMVQRLAELEAAIDNENIRRSVIKQMEANPKDGGG